MAENQGKSGQDRRGGKFFLSLLLQTGRKTLYLFDFGRIKSEDLKESGDKE
jgi:hypothetical protein